MKDIILGKSKIGQFDTGVFANRDFKKGEIVLKYNLKVLSQKEFDNLPAEEKKFTHERDGVIYSYPAPERYVNHSDKPNTVQDFEIGADIAIRDIKKGEEITTNAKLEDY